MSETNNYGCQCGCDCKAEKENKKLNKSLVIKWQRLISEGSTCPRCGSTENELEKALEILKDKLIPLGVEVAFEKTELTLEEFKHNPTSSNQILFNDHLLEDLIDAKTGQSQCCDVCGDEECRTVEIEGKSLETIPAEIIVKAGLKAISQ